MLDADYLGSALRFIVANEAGAAMLHWMRGVSKEWYKAATRMLANETWRAPLDVLTAAFIADMAQLARELDDDNADAPYTSDTQARCTRFPERMQAYSADAVVQGEALVLVGLILKSRPPGAALAKRVAAVAVGVMKAHPSLQCVQAKACAVLLTLANVRSDAFCEHGVVLQLLRMLERAGPPLESVAVLLRIFDWCVDGLRGSRAGPDTFVAAGGVSVLLRTMAEHRTSAVFQLQALHCLERLSYFHPALLAAAGAAESLFACLRLFPAHCEINEVALRILLAFERSGQPYPVDFFATSRGMELLLQVGPLQGLQKMELLDALRRRCPEMVSRMVAGGLLPCVMQTIVRDHAFENSCAGMRILAALSSDAQYLALVMRPLPPSLPLSIFIPLSLSLCLSPSLYIYIYLNFLLSFSLSLSLYSSLSQSSSLSLSLSLSL